MKKPEFQCGNCAHIFSGTKQTSFSEAKPGEYWFTAEGFVGKCPYCGSYSKCLTPSVEPIIDEIMDRIPYERTTGEFFRGLQSAYIQYMADSGKNKEENTMKVSYKGVTGELVRLERVDMSGCVCAHPYKWELDIWDNEKRCKVSFSGVSLKDVKFMGGEVTYG